MNNLNIQKMKLFVLQKRYFEICNSVRILQEHVSFLFKNNFVELTERNVILSKLLEISKNLNSKYNEYINNEIESTETSESSELSDLNNDVNVLSSLANLDDMFKNTDIDILNLESRPLIEFSEKVIKIMEMIGYGNLINTIKVYIGEIKYTLLSQKIISYLTEIDYLSYTVSINLIKNNDFNINFGDTDYVLEIPEDFESNDFLELTRFLFIKLNDTDILKIGLVFKNDLVNINLKSSQVNLKHLYNKKNKILESLEKKDTDIDNKFIKLFLRYDYLGNIYSMSTSRYEEFILENFEKYLEIINYTVLNLMKDFLSKESSLKSMFTMIFLLLLGDEENSDIAGILLGLLKEKKNMSKSIYNLFYDNLSFYLQIKLKKSNNSLKEQVNKIKTLNMEDVDYTKQLISNKAIPDNIKSLTIEKIEEMKSFNNEYFKQHS